MTRAAPETARNCGRSSSREPHRFLGDPTASQTALASRQAIWRKADPAWPVCGLPAALYSDHGSDFTSYHMAQVCANVKVQLIHSTAGNPANPPLIHR